MRIIQSERVPLKAPDNTVLEQTYEEVRSIHAQAYGWEPPPVLSVERLSTTRMREYVKGWITEWDLKRLDPGYNVEIEVTELTQDYTEDPNLQIATEEGPNTINPNQE